MAGRFMTKHQIILTRLYFIPWYMAPLSFQTKPGRFWVTQVYIPWAG